jgi:hypothetical protein
MQHDRYVIRDERQQPGQFNFGFVAAHQGFRTVMSYRDECADLERKCPRVLYFSTPNIWHNGVPAGLPLSNPEAAYNVEQLCRAAPIASQFR